MSVDLARGLPDDPGVSQPIEYRWRGPVTDAEMVALVIAHGGRAAAGWWDQIRPHSLGWVTARQPDGALAGFVNVAWDGGDHAFLLDTKVAAENQRQGIATALVDHAARHSKAAGCEWLHVDFEEHLLGSTSMPAASAAPQLGSSTWPRTDTIENLPTNSTTRDGPLRGHPRHCRPADRPAPIRCTRIRLAAMRNLSSHR
jgi:GNAT superfamily N-acetyltransferase